MQSPIRHPIDTPCGGGVKYIIVTGGVCSSLGKGVTVSTIGALLRCEGYRVTCVKIDPYLNIDAGLMSPFEHGEVFVLDDGGEVDLDLGNYERWMRLRLGRRNNITTGKVFTALMEGERRGLYLGRTITLTPHFTNEVISQLQLVATTAVDGSGLRPDICLVELGGTVGDMESAPFCEALRGLRCSLPASDCCLLHCTYIPSMAGQQKSKPTQHSCRSLMQTGLIPDFLVCRSETQLDPAMRRKVSQYCGIAEQFVIDAHNVGLLYEVPLLFLKQDVISKLQRLLRLRPAVPDMRDNSGLEPFSKYVSALRNPLRTVRIAFVGKYLTGGSDTYISILQAFEHCCIELRTKIEFLWVDSDSLEDPNNAVALESVTSCDGIFIPGGFGMRGVEGKCRAVRIARERDIPFFGVCLGLQVAVIEFARNVLKLPTANSEEFDKTAEHLVIRYMPDVDRATMGASMRLGGCGVDIIDPQSKLAEMYGYARRIRERHRHRYEVNGAYIDEMVNHGMRITAVDDASHELRTAARVEAIELPSNRFFVAVQYHPEYRSDPSDPAPTYLAFLAATARLKLDRQTPSTRVVPMDV